MPFGAEGVIAGAAAVFFAFLGFDAISASAEEVKNPQRNPPIGIIGSLLICTIIYIVVCLVMTGMVHYTQLNVTEAMSYVLQSVHQNSVAGIISVGAVIGLMAVISPPIIMRQLELPMRWAETDFCLKCFQKQTKVIRLLLAYG
ncbi:hypothetical protein BsIDN1_04670 [Bacillus safensis]|uniref:Amino acid permease/ SLC12A domain-containing protein n=1 Tax=Bacillus safensis TaxID=561879 RepID=A0A5S9M4L7_BACIA|nr:hypothetical protein BsIDN1_04670 [Bacillus safensis]